MSAHFPPTSNLCAASPTTTDGRDEVAQLRNEIAVLRLENARLRHSLGEGSTAALSQLEAPQADGISPVLFNGIETGDGQSGTCPPSTPLFKAWDSVFPTGIFRTDAAGVIIEIDSNLQHIFDLELPEFAHLGWLAAVHPEDRARAQAQWLDCVARPRSQSIELRVLRPEGQIRHMLVRNLPSTDAAGQFEGHVGFVQDITELRNLETGAKLQEELNRQIIASSPDCTKVLDLQGRVLQMTTKGCLLMEVDNFEDVRHRLWSSWWPDEGAPLARACWENAARGETTRFVGFCPTFKGTSKWWDTVISPICNTAGETAMLLVVSRDISEQHRQQEEIKALNQSLETRVQLRTQELAKANQHVSQTLQQALALYNQAPCGYHSLDGEGTYLRINQTELDWLGCQREEVVGKHRFSDHVAPAFKTAIEERLARLACGDTPEPVEVDLVCRDGQRLRVLLSCSAVFDDQGRLVQINATAVDISARQAALQALADQRAFLQTITDIVPVQMSFYDRHLICQFANASYARWLNVPPEKLIGLHLSEVARPENFADAQNHLHAALAGETQRFEGSRTFPDGLSFYASIEYTPYRVDGEVQGIVIQLIDISARKAAEDRVRDINSQLNTALEQAQNLYNQAPCGYHSLNADGVYVSVNDTELQWLGYQRHEVIGKKTPKDFVSPRLAQLMDERLHRLIEQDRLGGAEYEMYRRDGTPFWALVSSSAVRDASGRFLQSNTTVVDITERKTAELALHANQRFIQAITDHVPGLIAYLDTDLRFRFANANHLTLFGMDPRAIFGKPLRACISINIWDAIAPRLQATLAGERQHFEAWQQTVQGQPIFVSATYLPDWHEGKVQGIFIQMIDITERKRVEERVSGLNVMLEQRIQVRSAELLASEQRFRLMVDNMRDHGIFFLDANGTISDWTESAQRMKGYSASEMLGQHYSRLFDPSAGVDTRVKAQQILALAASRGQHEATDWHQRKDGSRYWGYALLVALRDGTGELFGFAEIARDMTDTKRLDDLMYNINDELEARVAKRTEQLVIANKDLEAFSYSVSHDLRSPLRHISSFVSLLQEHLADQCDEISARYLGTIGSSARHMSLLIDGLLTFSRLGRSALKSAPVNIALLVDTVIAELTHEPEGRIIDWVVAPDLPVVQGDAVLLREVWANLLGNAQKYTRPRQRTQIEVGWRTDSAKSHIFYVRDNGVGFDTKYAAKLFGVFQRLHRMTEFEGTGIGLALTRRIIERHGGTIWAESQLGEGSTFSFSLPLESLSAA